MNKLDNFLKKWITLPINTGNQGVFLIRLYRYFVSQIDALLKNMGDLILLKLMMS